MEERDGLLHGYEFKWNPAQKVKETKLWRETYPNTTFNVVQRDNFLEFIA